VPEIHEILQHEVVFHDAIAGNFQINAELIRRYLSYDTPASNIAEVIPRLKQDVLKEVYSVRGKRVLVYGCGSDSAAVWFALHGASVDAIDISPKSVTNQEILSGKLGLYISAHVMDAHQLKFPDNEYDIVYGNAILHHIELRRAIPEIMRVLKPDGTAVFRDVMIGNVFLRAFRYATPFWRTPDEHPLTRKDLELLGETFDMKISQYVLTGLPYMFAVRIINNVILKEMGIKSRIQLHPKICRCFDNFDQRLFRYAPFLKTQAWLCLIVLTKKVA